MLWLWLVIKMLGRYNKIIYDTLFWIWNIQVCANTEQWEANTFWCNSVLKTRHEFSQPERQVSGQKSGIYDSVIYHVIYSMHLKVLIDVLNFFFANCNLIFKPLRVPKHTQLSLFFSPHNKLVLKHLVSFKWMHLECVRLNDLCDVGMRMISICS